MGWFCVAPFFNCLSSNCGEGTQRSLHACKKRENDPQVIVSPPEKVPLNYKGGLVPGVSRLNEFTAQLCTGTPALDQAGIA